MARKIHKAEEIFSKLRQVDVLMSQGTAVGGRGSVDWRDPGDVLPRAA